MTYREQWEVLSGRIRGLMQAGELHARYLAVHRTDTFARWKRLRDQSRRVRTELQCFKNSFQTSLPPAALTAIDEFIENTTQLVDERGGTLDMKQERVWAALVMLSSFETEMSYLLSDYQESVRTISERAFSHLQRLIVADIDARTKWKRVYQQGEGECEKLGAAHLLWHGIWAFKVNTQGERTDLVFNEPAGNLIDEQRYIDGFVLTEWKKADPDRNAPERFKSARDQAALYAQGALAGSELTTYRYAVVVSRRQIAVPADVEQGGIVYRNINIAVDPEPPSRRAQAAS